MFIAWIISSSFFLLLLLFFDFFLLLDRLEVRLDRFFFFFFFMVRTNLRISLALEKSLAPYLSSKPALSSKRCRLLRVGSVIPVTVLRKLFKMPILPLTLYFFQNK